MATFDLAHGSLSAQKHRQIRAKAEQMVAEGADRTTLVILLREAAALAEELGYEDLKDIPADLRAKARKVWDR